MVQTSKIWEDKAIFTFSDLLSCLFINQDFCDVIIQITLFLKVLRQQELKFNSLNYNTFFIFSTAIKMGRPKKADSADLTSSTNNADFDNHNSPSPKASPQEKAPSPGGSHYSPISSPARTTGSPMFDLSKVKVEPESCDLDKQTSDSSIVNSSQSDSSFIMQTSGQSFSPTPMTSYTTASTSGDWACSNTMSMAPQSNINWNQQIAQSVAQQQMITSAPTQSTNLTMTTSKSGVNDNSLMYEDDMDEILDLLSQDSTVPTMQQNTSQNSQCMMGNQQAPNFPVPTQKQFEQQIREYHSMQSEQFHQLNVDTSTHNHCGNSPHMYSQGSPQNHHFLPSQNHGSPVQYNTHSPTSQPMYGPHSPSQGNIYGPRSSPHDSSYSPHCSSPQNSAYSPGSPAHDGPYSPQGSNQYVQGPSMYQQSPHYPASPESCQYSARSPANESCQYSARSPASDSGSCQYSAGSPASHCSMSPPYQPPSPPYHPQGAQSAGPYIDIKSQMKINQMFLNSDNFGSNMAELDNVQMDGPGLTSHDMNLKVIEDSLTRDLSYSQYYQRNAVNNAPGASPVYNGSDDSQDSYTEAHRFSSKRKCSHSNGFLDNSYSQCLYDQGGQDFLCERYSMRDCKSYWNRPLSYTGPTVPEEEAVSVINHVMMGYNKFRDVCDESITARNSLVNLFLF